MLSLLVDQTCIFQGGSVRSADHAHSKTCRLRLHDGKEATVGYPIAFVFVVSLVFFFSVSPVSVYFLRENSLERKPFFASRPRQRFPPCFSNTLGPFERCAPCPSKTLVSLERLTPSNLDHLGGCFSVPETILPFSGGLLGVCRTLNSVRAFCSLFVNYCRPCRAVCFLFLKYSIPFDRFAPCFSNTLVPFEWLAHCFSSTLRSSLSRGLLTASRRL